MSQLHVMHIIYSLYAGGAEEVIASYARSYDRSRYRLSVLVLTDGGPLVDRIRSYGVPVICLKKDKRLDLGTFRTIWQLLRREKVDIIHAHNPAGNNWGVPTALIAGIKVFIRTEHNVFYKGRVSSYYPLINFFLNLFNDKIIACSDFVRQSQMRYYLIPKKKFITIHNGIVPDRFKTDPAPDYLNRHFSIPPNVPVICSVGALIKQKGHIYLLKAAMRVLRHHPEAQFLIVGEGKLRASLKNKASELKIDQSVIFTGVRQDIPEILAAADIFAMASLWEGLPMVILEAMASQMAIVVTDVGGNREAIRDGETGFVVPACAPDIMADRICQLIERPNFAKTLARSAYARLSQEFTATHMVRQTEKLYQTCLGSLG